MHRTDTEREMRELVRKGQEESLTTPTTLDAREKGGAGAQRDGAGKGMQAGKPVLIGGKDAAVTGMHDGGSRDGRLNSLDEQEGLASARAGRARFSHS